MTCLSLKICISYHLYKRETCRKDIFQWMDILFFRSICTFQSLIHTGCFPPYGMDDVPQKISFFWQSKFGFTKTSWSTKEIHSHRLAKNNPYGLSLKGTEKSRLLPLNSHGIDFTLSSHVLLFSHFL